MFNLLIFFCFADDCSKDDGTICTNGVCLDSQCHCNDGFGGCNCQVPGNYLHRNFYNNHILIVRSIK